MPSQFPFSLPFRSVTELIRRMIQGWSVAADRRSALAGSWASRSARNEGVGSQSPMRRCATIDRSRPPASASARVMSCCETPTRNPPLISLFQTNRCRWSKPRQARVHGRVALIFRHFDPQGKQPLGDPVAQGEVNSMVPAAAAARRPLRHKPHAARRRMDFWNSQPRHTRFLRGPGSQLALTAQLAAASDRSRNRPPRLHPRPAQVWEIVNPGAPGPLHAVVLVVSSSRAYRSAKAFMFISNAEPKRFATSALTLGMDRISPLDSPRSCMLCRPHSPS